MSSNKRTPDDDWFDALGGSEKPGGDAHAQASARKLRQDYLSTFSRGDAETVAHQEAELQRLLTRLESEGHFGKKDNVSAEPIGSIRSKRWMDLFSAWSIPLGAAAAFIALVGILVPHILREEFGKSPDAVERGMSSTQIRVSADPVAAASRLCEELKPFSNACTTQNREHTVVLTALIRDVAGATAVLFREELVLDAKDKLTVEFRKVGKP